MLAVILTLHDFLTIAGDLNSISTDNLPWAEMLEYDFCKTFTISELNRLRSFIKDGVTFNVIAVKHSYVPEDPNLSEEQNKENGGQACAASEKQSVKTSASKDRTKLDPKERKKSAKAKVFIIEIFFTCEVFQFHIRNIKFTYDFTCENVSSHVKCPNFHTKKFSYDSYMVMFFPHVKCSNFHIRNKKFTYDFT